MARLRRFIPPDCVVHVLNRRTDRRRLFENSRDYEHFLWLVAKTKRSEPVRIIAYGIMPNHWHFVLWPDSPLQISRFFHRLTGAHAASIRLRSGTVGEGHIYQDRFRDFVVESEYYYYQVLRYVEANPLKASLVKRAENWRWSSLSERLGLSRALVEPGPLPLPDRWVDIVNDQLSFREIDEELAKAESLPPRQRVGRK
jgi:putative transposase